MVFSKLCKILKNWLKYCGEEYFKVVQAYHVVKGTLL